MRLQVGFPQVKGSLTGLPFWIPIIIQHLILQKGNHNFDNQLHTLGVWVGLRARAPRFPPGGILKPLMGVIRYYTKFENWDVARCLPMGVSARGLMLFGLGDQGLGV